MALFDASLCQMLNGETVPYDMITIDLPGLSDAVERAKAWTKTVDVREDSWLVIKLGSHSAATLKPGEF